MPEPHLAVTGLACTVGGFHLRAVDLAVQHGSYHLLLGPTGSGKSTLLKCLLGLQGMARGRILLAGRDISGLAPEQRGIGYVPQNHALFPHLSVKQNIRFGVVGRHAEAAERAVRRAIDLLSLGALLPRRVAGLSGGERQKVALARALAIRPELLLLDEPFSAIDEGARRHLWLELKRAVREIGITTIHVTHSLDEAYAMGEEVSVLIHGRLAQSGTCQSVFHQPADEPVARYLNYGNIFHGRAEVTGQGAILDVGGFTIRVHTPLPQAALVGVCVRPQDVKIIRDGMPLDEQLAANTYTATIRELYLLPQHCVLMVQVKGSPRPFDFEVRCPEYMKERHQLDVGGTIRIALWQPNIIVFPQPAKA